MVTALKVSSTPLFSSDCSAPAAIGASVNTKDSMVAMSGAIMPAPLAMPLMVTLALPSFTVAVATFGKVSVVMIARAALIQSPGAACPARLPSTPSNLVASSGSPITPVEARNTSSGLAADRLGGDRGGQRRGLPAGLAGEGVGVAGIDHQRAGACRRGELGAAPFHRRRRAFRLGEDAGDRRALVHHRQQHVGAALVADAGGRRRELHARDRGHVGDIGRGERGDGGGHGANPADERQEALGITFAVRTASAMLPATPRRSCRAKRRIKT